MSSAGNLLGAALDTPSPSPLGWKFRNALYVLWTSQGEKNWTNRRERPDATRRITLECVKRWEENDRKNSAAEDRHVGRDTGRIGTRMELLGLLGWIPTSPYVGQIPGAEDARMFECRLLLLLLSTVYYLASSATRGVECLNDGQ